MYSQLCLSHEFKNNTIGCIINNLVETIYYLLFKYIIFNVQCYLMVYKTVSHFTLNISLSSSNLNVN